MISVRSLGSWSETEAFLSRMQARTYLTKLEKYGPIGVDALKAATPKDDGDTAAAWSYEIVQRPGYFSIKWDNTNVDSQGTPIAVLIQYGHGTRGGGYIQGIDYINPAMRPIFEQIVVDMWEEVTRSG